MGLAASFEATIKLRQQRADALLAGMSPIKDDQMKIVSPDKQLYIRKEGSSMSIPSF
jgi:hypothetical protein